MKKILSLTLITSLVTFLICFDTSKTLNQTLLWIESLGNLGPLIFITIYIIATILLIPGSILTLGAGAIFGVVYGSIYVSIAATLGATAAFIIGRYLARGWIEEKTHANKRFEAINKAVSKEGWKIVGLTRLSPVFPFTFLNYAYGLTKVSLKDYFLASWIGMIPGTIMYVYIGSLAGSLATLGSNMQERTRTKEEWALYMLGLIATLIVTIYVTKIAKKSLEEIIE